MDAASDGTEREPGCETGATAALLAVVVALPGNAQPAQAFDLDDIEKVIEVVDKAVTLVKNILGGGTSEAAIEAAVQQIVAEIEASKTEILAHGPAMTSGLGSALRDWLPLSGRAMHGCPCQSAGHAVSWSMAR